MLMNRISPLKQKYNYYLRIRARLYDQNLSDLILCWTKLNLKNTQLDDAREQVGSENFFYIFFKQALVTILL